MDSKVIWMDQTQKPPVTEGSQRGGKRLDPEQKSKWWDAALLILGVVAEVAGIIQLFLALVPSGEAAVQNNVNTGGGNSAQYGQYITAGDNAQIFTQMGGNEAAFTPEPAEAAGLSEEERNHIESMFGEEQLARASDFIRNGQYKKAEQVLELLLEHGDHSQNLMAAAYYNRGLARYYQKQPDLARSDFLRSTQAKGSSQAYYCLGIVNHILNNYEQAVRAYSNALNYEDSDEKKVDIYLARAAANACWKDAPSDAAFQDYQTVLGIDQGNSIAMVGIERLKSGRK